MPVVQVMLDAESLKRVEAMVEAAKSHAPADTAYAVNTSSVVRMLIAEAPRVISGAKLYEAVAPHLKRRGAAPAKKHKPAKITKPVFK